MPHTHNTRVRSRSKSKSYPDESDDPNDEEISPNNDDQSPSIVDRQTSTFTKNPEDAKSTNERIYLVVSPGMKKKRSTKRREKPEEQSGTVETDLQASSNAAKSARNYMALKTTDDMFKGGVEQSNPLGVDKPMIESPNLSSSSSSSSRETFGNSLLSSRSYKTKTDKSGSKVIESVRDTEKMLQPEISMEPRKMFRRRLNQIVDDDESGRGNFSSASLVSTTGDKLYSTTLTHQVQGRLGSVNGSFSDIWVTTNHDDKHVENNLYQNFDVKSDVREIVSTTVKSLTTITGQTCATALNLHNSSSIKETHNNTRMRRNAGTFSADDSPKLKRHRVRHVDDEEIGKGQKRRSIDAVGTEARRRKLTVMLAADNIEDESQIDLAVHGELAGKIVERIFEEVQRNEGLKVALGPGLYRKHKPQESIALDKLYRQGLDEEEVKETETMMRRVMELLGRLVLDEVRRKTCASLAPDMHDFLQWSLGLEELAEPSSDQGPPLPMIPENRLHEATERPPPSADKYLFEGPPNVDSSGSNELSELQRKVALLKSLINEYRALTEREKTKVQTVHDYLVRQLGLLMKYIESKEASDKKRISDKTETAGARLPSGKENILQYQGSMPNRDSKKSREIGSNATIDEPTDRDNNRSTFQATSSIIPHPNDDSQESKRFWPDRITENRDSPEPRKFNREKNRRAQNFEPDSSIEYRKLFRRIATLRRKKRDDSWGYEVPKIYNIGPMELSPISTIVDHERSATQSYASDRHVESSTTLQRAKNRADDEIMLLNKREAWKKENERLLEEVAFGKDTRNDFATEQRGSFDRDSEARIKRQFDDEISSIRTTTHNLTTSENDDSNNDLRSVEKKINVFPVDIDNEK